MQTFLELLVAQSRAPEVVVNGQLDAALTQLDSMIARLAEDVAVEYYGPDIGINAGKEVYKLVVRQHEWQIHEPAWSLRVCTALPHAGWRADWAIQGASRLRKKNIVKALPAFFVGFAAAITQAGKAETNAGSRILQLSKLFSE